MRTRRDQVQAYRFVTRRVVSAMLSGEPETPELPMRRLTLALLGSVMVAAVVFAGAGVYGLVTKQGAPLDANTLVIERETEARYIYVDDRLHPVLNYSSARLALGTAEPVVRRVARSSLQGLPRGHPIGIVNAPDSLPDPDTLLGLPWRICSVPPGADAPQPTTVAVLGREVAGTAELGDLALYVTDGEHGYLLWNNTLLKITEPLALVALGMAATEPIRVGQQLINAATAGPDLAVVRPPGFGEPSSVEIGGRQALIGFLYIAAGQHYVMTRDGLVPVGDFTIALREAIGASTIREITGAEANRALATNRPLEPQGYPMAVPQIHPANGRASTICAAYRGSADGALATTLEILDTAPPELLPSGPDTVQVRQTGRDVVATVDTILLGAGQGALVQAIPGAGTPAAGDPVYLVTAQGIKYQLEDRSGDARAALGYGSVTALPVPAALVALLPTGPTLDIELARQPAVEDAPAPGGTGGGTSAG